jgi:hypothetical protein
MAATEPTRNKEPVQRAVPEPHKGTPTPTQAENDAVAMGDHDQPLADDGSGPDPNVPEAKSKKDMTSRPSSGQGYPTRDVRSSTTKHE